MIYLLIDYVTIKHLKRLYNLQEERGRLMRRNIVRYSMLSYVITLQHVSLRVKQRFPSWQHMVDAGELRASYPGDLAFSMINKYVPRELS
jgi:hypothetical protein